MKWLNMVLNGRSALKSVDLSDMVHFITDEQRDKLQQILLEIYADIVGVCMENGLTPFLIGGSALGAVRHKGFIPWDDDLDLGMMREDYEKFLPIFENKFSEKYIVSTPRGKVTAIARFTKIIKKGTEFRQLFSSKEESLNGIFVDIFPIDNVPDNKLQKKYKGLVSDCFAYISSQVYLYCNRTPSSQDVLKRTGQINCTIRMFIGKLFSIKRPDWWFAQFDKCVQYPDKNTCYCTIAPGRKHYFGEIMEKGKILPARYIEFCGLNAAVFNDVDAYLSNLYGDYMKIPPEEKRERHNIEKLKF